MAIDMKEIGFFKLLGYYMKQHIILFVQFCLFTIIFLVVFFLSSIALEAVAYAFLLCIVIGFIWGVLDFCSFYKKHNNLCEAFNQITLSIDKLPQPKNIIEADYQQLIEAVHNDKIRIASNLDNARSDLIDYYTLWAHQIKTPIAAMKLLLQTEENENNSELSLELFKIEQYVEMVLQYLRLDSDYTDFVIKKYDLDNMVRQAVRKYAKVFIQKKINLDFEPISRSVLTDEKWFVFVIEQLLSNALKYTNKGKISIYIQNDNTLVIEDSGIGIQSEDLPRIFDKGFTGYNGRIDKKSTGIGLYLCKRILSKLSHTIDVESTIEKGSKFKIGLDMIDIKVE